MKTGLLFVLASLLMLSVIACSGGETPTPTSTPTPTPDTPTQPTPETAVTPALPDTSPEPLILVLEISSGSEARYRVREQLAFLDFPNDAVGVTQDVEGKLVLGTDGAVSADLVTSLDSLIRVDLSTLQSDEDRRDNYVRNRTLGTGQYPHTEFVPTTISGLQWPLPSTGEASFSITGDMTIRDVTKEVTWETTAQFNEDSITGTATTDFTFDEFDLNVPSVAVVLSVENNIRLEIDFVLQKTES